MIRAAAVSLSAVVLVLHQHCRYSAVVRTQFHCTPASAASAVLLQGFSESAPGCSRKSSQRLYRVCSGVPASASPQAAQYKRSACHHMRCCCRCAVDSVNEMSGVQVPYDPHLPPLFFGEETSMAARLYTNGWDFFAPTQAVVYHLWSREYRHTFTVQP